MIIKFLPFNKIAITKGNRNLLDIAAEAGVNIDGSCMGNGTCGKCAVKIIEGNSNNPTEHEKKFYDDEELKRGWRLACKTYPEEDMVVWTSNSDTMALKKSDMSILPEEFTANSGFRIVDVTVPRATLEDSKSDVERIIDAGAKAGIKALEFCDIDCIKKVPRVLRKTDDVKLTVYKNQVLDINGQEDEFHNIYGMAFDIGTTTVVGIMWDLIKGEKIAASSAMNPQSIYGGDVISRIEFAGEEKGNLEVLQNAIISCLNEITQNCATDAHVSYDNIKRITVAGNTTMTHLLTGTDPKSLALLPFAPVFTKWGNAKAADLLLLANKNARVEVLPNIAGHVGSDITVGIMSVRLDELKGLTVFVDIGTNGEIVVAKDGKMLTCSTAAGPAFEGANIKQGMRASAGAVDSVKIENGIVSVTTIEDENAIGICGSGLVDAVGEMINAGVIEKSGRLKKKEKAIDAGLSQDIINRIEGTKGDLQFILKINDNGSKVAITQNDIREVQLAKGAISTGIKMLVESLSMTVDDIDKIIIAGAFGNHIRKENALKIGLVPDVGEDKIISAGNTAGVGACMALLSLTSLRKTYEIAEQVTHVELGGSPEFQDLYLKEMSFTK